MTESLLAINGRSLRWKLLAPMAVFWAALAVIAILGLRWEAERRLEQSLARRAEVLANLVNYNAESAATRNLRGSLHGPWTPSRPIAATRQTKFPSPRRPSVAVVLVREETSITLSTNRWLRPTWRA